jgi:hypothetical protein
MVAYHACVHTSALGTIRAPKKKASRYTVRLGTQGCTLARSEAPRSLFRRFLSRRPCHPPSYVNLRYLQCSRPTLSSKVTNLYF